MKKIKCCLIGGGSYSWTDSLYMGFANNPFFNRDNMELCLYDINPVALETVFSYINMVNEANPDNAITVTKTLSEDEAMEGADYVIIAISNGGLEGEMEDHYIARRHGFYNVKGSESGIAGASRTIRHVPEFVRIATKMKKLCPNAMILNVTNPLTSLVRCVEKYAGIPSIGFCHGIINHLEIVEPYFGCHNPYGSILTDISMSVSGVDHCSFVTDLKFKGEDALQIMRDKGMIEAAWRGDSITMQDYFAGKENQRIRFILWDMLGTLPGLSDEHCAEFYYQTTGTEANRDTYGMHYDRLADRPASVTRMKKAIEDKLAAKDTQLRYSDEQIHLAVEALNGGRQLYTVMNYKNIGQCREFPKDMVVETFCTIDATGVHPSIASPLPNPALTVALATGYREEMFMEAAMEWNEDKLVAALVNDPLVMDFSRVRDVAHDIMEYNKKWLPKDFEPLKRS